MARALVDTAAGLVTLVLAACGPPRGSTPPAAPTEPAPPPAAQTPPSETPPASSAGPLEVEPREAGDGLLPHEPTALIETHGGTMMDHATRFGWSRDGKTFVTCHEDGGLGCTHCRFVDLDGHTEILTGLGDGMAEDDTGGQCTQAHTREIERRFATRDIGIHQLQWAHGGAQVLYWRAQQSEERSTLLVGARVRDGTALGQAIRIELPMALVHPEVLLPSPDGEHLAVVAHAFAGEFSDTFAVELVALGPLAARAYDAEGVQVLAKGDTARAIALLEQATAADPQGWKAPYDLARACVHADASCAEAALRQAIAREPTQAPRRAREDPAFAPVHDEPWFRELIGGAPKSKAQHDHAHGH